MDDATQRAIVLSSIIILAIIIIIVTIFLSHAKMDKNSKTVALFFLCALSVIILIVIGSIAIINQHKFNTCHSHPAPYCYTNWTCKDPENPEKEINMSDLALYGQGGILTTCPPLKEEMLENFIYLDKQKVLHTGHPQHEKNIWGNKEGEIKTCKDYLASVCVNKGLPTDLLKREEYAKCIAEEAEKTDLCPYYEVGDVYWPSCNNAQEESNYYVRPEIYEELQKNAEKNYLHSLRSLQSQQSQRSTRVQR
jgi:hypothetical protein